MLHQDNLRDTLLGEKTKLNAGEVARTVKALGMIAENARGPSTGPRSRL